MLSKKDNDPDIPEACGIEKCWALCTISVENVQQNQKIYSNLLLTNTGYNANSKLLPNWKGPFLDMVNYRHESVPIMSTLIMWTCL